MYRIHRFWSDRLLAGGALWAVLLFGGSIGCDKSDDETVTAEADEASPDGQTDQSPQPSERAESDEVPVPGGTDPRTFEFKYQATLEPDDRAGPVEIFLPVATDTPHQTILEHDIDSPIEGQLKEESTYGNTYWHASLDELPDEPTTITMTYEVRREVFRRADLDQERETEFNATERDEYALFLKANERVPIGGDLIEEVAGDIGFTEEDSPLDEARAIYDHVVDTMEYKKKGDGWGNGDTYWACNEEYGNCTDFHALFTSLARHREIPARFEIGFPVPTDRKSGEIGGYHCWLDFYLPGVGWTPIDASEAKKNPEYRDVYFGTHPADRIQFSVGRDLQLGEAHKSEPLNYFIYPLVEVGGERYDGVSTTFSYREKTS